MADTTIQTKPNGPYLVTGDFTLLDSQGQRIEVRGKVSLCRCGASAIKPICDGAHKKCSFDIPPLAPLAPAVPPTPSAPSGTQSPV